MRLSRFYQTGELPLGSEVQLNKEVSNHIHRVLRLQTDDQIQLFNGNGYNYQAVILTSGKKVNVEILSQVKAGTESHLKIHLGQAISKGERMDFTLQKSVELGVESITPLISERVQFRFDQKRMQKKMIHWQKIIESACEQSGRATVPELHPALPLTEWITIGEVPGFLLVPEANVSLMEIAEQHSLRLLVGPEGGLSDDEVAIAMQSDHFTAINLGPRILRTETAALAAISILQARFGDI